MFSQPNKSSDWRFEQPLATSVILTSVICQHSLRLRDWRCEHVLLFSDKLVSVILLLSLRLRSWRFGNLLLTSTKPASGDVAATKVEWLEVRTSSSYFGQTGASNSLAQPKVEWWEVRTSSYYFSQTGVGDVPAHYEVQHSEFRKSFVAEYDQHFSSSVKLPGNVSSFTSDVSSHCNQPECGFPTIARHSLNSSLCARQVFGIKNQSPRWLMTHIAGSLWENNLFSPLCNSVQIVIDETSGTPRYSQQRCCEWFLSPWEALQPASKLCLRSSLHLCRQSSAPCCCCNRKVTSGQNFFFALGRKIDMTA